MKPKLKIKPWTWFRCSVCGDKKTRGVLIKEPKGYVKKVCAKQLCVDLGEK